MRWLYIGVLLGAALCACSEDAGNSMDPAPPGFELQFAVSDSAGVAVEGVQVSAWSVLTGIPLPPISYIASPAKPIPSEYVLYQNFPNPFNGSTVFRWDLPVFGWIRLTMLRLDGSVADQYSADSLPAGSHEYTWAAPVNQSTLYWVRMSSGVNGSTNFVDSICIAAWSPAPAGNILGYADIRGVVVTVDSARFPGLFDPPQMPRTDAVGPDTIGLFAASDSIQITVTDTAAAQSQSYRRKLEPGFNAFELTW